MERTTPNIDWKVNGKCEQFCLSYLYIRLRSEKWKYATSYENESCTWITKVSKKISTIFVRQFTYTKVAYPSFFTTVSSLFNAFRRSGNNHLYFFQKGFQFNAKLLLHHLPYASAPRHLCYMHPQTAVILPCAHAHASSSYACNHACAAWPQSPHPFSSFCRVNLSPLPPVCTKEERAVIQFFRSESSHERRLIFIILLWYWNSLPYSQDLTTTDF